MLLLIIALCVRHFLIQRDMYRAFLADKAEKAKENKSSHQNIPGVDEAVTGKVEEIWKQIESQCVAKKPTVIEECKEKTARSDWQIVRLFVSSTFADFFNEREVLVKKVFPELREWCQDRNLKLIECDLRWGVPRDTPSEQTISICLEEIDKCIDVSNGSPLFIGLLGERYGWIPPDSDVSLDTRHKYQWVDDTSITSMEILHGAYRTRNPNAGFFIRNSNVLADIPESHLRYFVDKDPMAAYHLKILKDKLESALPNQIFHYESKFKQMSEVGDGKEPRVELEGLEDFAKKTLEFLKSAVLRIHPGQESKEIDSRQQEEQIQWLYVLDKTNNMIGRQAEKDILMKFLTDGIQDQFERTGGSSSQLRRPEEWEIVDSDVPLCVVEAPSGWGKTTLVSSVIKDIVNCQKDWTCFYHLIGSTPSSVRVETCLQRLLAALITDPEEREKAVKNEQYSHLISELKRALSKFRQRPSEKLVIVIDNLNALSNSDTLHHLSWLPPRLPPNIRCIVSTNQHPPTTSRVYEHPTLKLSLSAMTQDQISEIATQYLGTFSKKLHPSQLTALFTKTKVDNPLWMSLMVEELRIFGSFDLMDKRIADMPTSLDAFLVQVFDRLIHEDTSQKNLIKKVLCVIASSQYGIPSDKVLQVLGDQKTKEPIALLEWLQVKRSLKPYLRTSGFLEETITFSNDAVHKAVCGHYLSGKTDVCYWNSVLSDFYQFQHEHNRQRAWTLLYHLKKGRLLQRMVQFMRSDRDSGISLPPFLRSDYLKDCRCRGLADAVIPGSSSVRLCHMCSMRPRAFNPTMPSPNKGMCVVCGNQCLNTASAQARACIKHGQQMGPNMTKCFVCKQGINIKNPPPNLISNPGLLCDFCGFANGAKRCAVLSCDSPF